MTARLTINRGRGGEDKFSAFGLPLDESDSFRFDTAQLPAHVLLTRCKSYSEKVTNGML